LNPVVVWLRLHSNGGLIYEAEKFIPPKTSLTSPVNTLNASRAIPERIVGMIVAPSIVTRRE